MTLDPIIIEQPETTALAILPSLSHAAHLLVIRDQTTHGEALELIVECKRRERIVEDTLKESIDASNKAHKSMTGLRSKLLAPFQTVRAQLEVKRQQYEREEADRRAAEERRLAAEQRQRDEARALAEAQSAIEEGDEEAAEAILEEAEQAPPPVVRVEPQLAKVEGTAIPRRYRCEVDSLQQLIRYVAANPQWTHLLEPAMPALNGLARSQREALSIPGVRVVAESSVSVRRA